MRPARQPMSKERKTGTFIVAGLTVMIVFGIAAVISAEQDDREAERRFDDLYCENYAQPGDPDCY